ncbi:hypothetical protein CFP65_6062 [Kitasatospora sp. MMS16-BH015]|uniref:SMI1/KNR4 family protein n=1 Tax=Kitasatospora sp. MMS16-BH015 TaxID=2018025 RepID=UPI000CA138FF|nr:SMI1/KNR4 family protein [Kitasatospora sp. MMS16-BH015]AUG80733.1 hypothetical protein CFP65_6062 [Kitasatospora sp. MMS16-BH015]
MNSTTSWDSTQVHARVAALAQGDPEQRRFGSSHHGYLLRPPLPEGTLRSFEQGHGITLPPSFRSFLEDVADGGAGPYYGIVGLTEEVDEEEALHDLRADGLRADFLSTPFPHTEACPGPGKGGTDRYSVTGTLVIGEIGCGTFSRLVVTGAHAGQVWIDDQIWAGLMPGPDFRDWYEAWLAAA